MQLQTKSGDCFLIDDADAGLVDGWAFYSHRTKRAGQVKTTAIHAYRRGRKIALASLLMSPPEGMVVDHINRDPLDNRRSNLRVVTIAENGRNLTRRAGVKSPGLGVSLGNRCKSRPYRARIQSNGRAVTIGYFETAEAAQAAYLAKAKELHGEIHPQP